MYFKDTFQAGIIGISLKHKGDIMAEGLISSIGESGPTPPAIGAELGAAALTLLVTEDPVNVVTNGYARRGPEDALFAWDT